MMLIAMLIGQVAAMQFSGKMTKCRITATTMKCQDIKKTGEDYKPRTTYCNKKTLKKDPLCLLSTTDEEELRTEAVNLSWILNSTITVANCEVTKRFAKEKYFVTCKADDALTTNWCAIKDTMVCRDNIDLSVQGLLKFVASNISDLFTSGNFPTFDQKNVDFASIVSLFNKTWSNALLKKIGFKPRQEKCESEMNDSFCQLDDALEKKMLTEHKKLGLPLLATTLETHLTVDHCTMHHYFLNHYAVTCLKKTETADKLDENATTVKPEENDDKELGGAVFASVAALLLLLA